MSSTKASSSRRGTVGPVRHLLHLLEEGREALGGVQGAPGIVLDLGFKRVEGVVKEVGREPRPQGAIPGLRQQLAALGHEQQQFHTHETEEPQQQQEVPPFGSGG